MDRGGGMWVFGMGKMGDWFVGRRGGGWLIGSRGYDVSIYQVESLAYLLPIFRSSVSFLFSVIALSPCSLLC